MCADIETQIHNTLLQYADFLAGQLSANDYEKVVPSVEELWGDYGIEAGVVLSLNRPKVVAAMRVSHIWSLFSVSDRISRHMTATTQLTVCSPFNRCNIEVD